MASMADIIGSNPLVQQMNNQGIPLSALSAVSPSSMNFQPDMQRPPLPPNGQGSPISGVPPLIPPQTAPSQPRQVQPMKSAVQPQVYNNEAQQIIEALTKRLIDITKIETKAKIPA
jgi:hypothetical protein